MQHMSHAHTYLIKASLSGRKSLCLIVLERLRDEQLIIKRHTQVRLPLPFTFYVSISIFGLHVLLHIELHKNRTAFCCVKLQARNPRRPTVVFITLCVATPGNIHGVLIFM